LRGLESLRQRWRSNIDNPSKFLINEGSKYNSNNIHSYCDKEDIIHEVILKIMKKMKEGIKC